MNNSTTKSILKKVRNLMIEDGIRYYNKAKKYCYSGYGNNLFDWELYFDSIVLGYFNAEEYIVNALRLFLEFQKENGFIPRHIYIGEEEEIPNAWRLFENEEHCKPFLCQIVLLISRIKGTSSWLTLEELEKLIKYLNYWFSACDRDGNGLSEWNSAPHSGADTQFERIGIWRSCFCEGVDLNCYLYRECLAAAELCKNYGFERYVNFFYEKANNYKDKIQKFLWDNYDGFFYDRDIRTGRSIRIKSASAFIPLWAGIATEEQAYLLVEKHLKNEGEFWTSFPIPSYARLQPSYSQLYIPASGTDPAYTLRKGHCNWCGGMWPHWEYFIVHGLENYGYHREALYIANKFFEVSINNPSLYEWYNAETGEGQGQHPFCAGASILGIFIPLEIEVGLDPTRILEIDEKLDVSLVKDKLELEPLPIY